MGPSNTSLRAGSTPSRSLEAKEKCIATLMFVGKDYPPPRHPPPQTAAREDAGSFCTAETATEHRSTPPDPASSRRCTCRLFFQRPYKCFMTDLLGPVYT